MKKIIPFIIVILFSYEISAQHLSYGVVFGLNSYDVETSGGGFRANSEPQLGFNLGVFGDYNFSQRLGIKTDLFYTSNKEGYRINHTPLRFENKVSYLLISPKLKFNISGDYDKGFYLLMGPRVSFLLSAKDDDDSDNKEFYKSSHYGLEFGVGATFLKHFSIEIIGDYGISDTTDSETETKSFGGFANLNINLESLLHN